MARFDGRAISARCACGHLHTKTIGWLKANSLIKCQCGRRLTYDPANLPRYLGTTERGVENFITRLKQQPLPAGFRIET